MKLKSKDPIDKKQEGIAIKTLKMPTAMVGVMGGKNLSKTDAIDFLKKIGYTDDEINSLSKDQITSRI